MRTRDWQTRLAAVVRDFGSRSFEYGGTDCCLFAAACVQACTGRDPLEGLPAWASEREALRVINAHHGLPALCAERLGAEVPPALAQPGDVGLMDDGGREALCVCVGAVWLATGTQGLVQVQTAAVRAAWRCDRG